ncbi:uncharacterized protein CDV56_102935 [Aspergillus thermomutatus]|uniref:Ubiquitin-like domain-containing protein n=1 Tax=Aspergillus thermomutatus TaxID=41047 RepID=A0A397G7I4_ASPTH|nr:uncharacterized protein CDV56_102935 [Aspergillus thermomutatus]RHZ45558.1 hypothetical protein CDV56_102935 [Aspergillus thermomutatus]
MSHSTSSLFETCFQRLSQLISSGRLTAYENEVPVVLWQDELGRLRIWAKETQLSSLDVRLSDAFHTQEDLFIIFRQLQRALADMRDVLDGTTADEAMSDEDTDDDDVDGTEMVILWPAHHPLVSGKVVGLSRYASSAETRSTTRTMVENEAATAMGFKPILPEEEAIWRDPRIHAMGIHDSYVGAQEDPDTLRQHAMEITQAASPDRIKLFYNGQVLEDDSLPCRDEGLKSKSTIHCEVLDSDKTDNQGISQATRREYEEMLQFSKSKTQTGPLDKGKNKDRMGNASLDQFALSPPCQSSSPPQAPDLSTFKTAAEQLLALESHLREVLAPLCDSFITDPPTDKEVRNSEHKKLEETILAQVILKAQNIEISGYGWSWIPSRIRRLLLIRRAQKMLRKLDQAAKLGSGQWF